MASKDKDTISKESGMIYRYRCDRVECYEEDIGESARTFGDRFTEHLKAPPLFMNSPTPEVNIPVWGTLA